MSTTTLYTARIARRSLRRWAQRMPREIGAALVSEAFQALLCEGDAGPLKSLEFIRHVDGRKRRRKEHPSIDGCSIDPAKVSAAVQKYGWRDMRTRAG